MSVSLKMQTQVWFHAKWQSANTMCSIVINKFMCFMYDPYLPVSNTLKTMRACYWHYASLNFHFLIDMRKRRTYAVLLLTTSKPVKYVCCCYQSNLFKKACGLKYYQVCILYPFKLLRFPRFKFSKYNLCLNFTQVCKFPTDLPMQF